MHTSVNIDFYNSLQQARCFFHSLHLTADITCLHSHTEVKERISRRLETTQRSRYSPPWHPERFPSSFVKQKGLETMAWRGDQQNSLSFI
ncbi:hypothetical protein CesoFtcFv8_006150 [Champsocephalus esox]|uniref:Uncharacterized protein n=1 Tax=Champsocephalus esox TaxID=159716 RepID=A0AAN8CM12_9TELE|nr:hypothetical protein CesoFtcFv8_006150 [Champsocephalus esox]